MALWGVGMAKALYANAVQAIGPDGVVIAQPIIPGTQTLVQGLIVNELCRSLVNAASGTSSAGTQMVQEPTPVAVGGTTGPMIYLSYNLSVGNAGPVPVCGSVRIPSPTSGQVNLAGVAVDQTAIQKTALTTVLANDIKSQMETIANQFFSTRKVSSLNGLMGVLTAATQDYTNQLTTAAQTVTQQLRASLASGGVASLAKSSANWDQLNALGFTGAGAYYLEFARLNGNTMSLLSSVPQITAPSYDGLGPFLSGDLAPLIQSSLGFMTTLSNYVTTKDGLSAPGGYADLFSGATPGEDGASLLDQVFRRLRLSDYMLQLLQTAISPSGNQWTDPFSALMSLGNTMVTISVGAMGLAALAASPTASAATTAFQLLTFNFAGAGVTATASVLMNFLGTPIFALLLAILIPGLTIAFVLPMVPWVMWIGGVAGWLILVCEAVIAVPLWMLAHMTMQGEGLHGKANQGYALLFNVMFRPVLMLFGLFLGYFIFSSTSFLIRQTFGIAAGFVLQRGWIVTNVLGVVVLLSIFVMTHVVAALMSFRMISLVLHHVPRLLGFSGGGRVDMDQFSKDAAIAGVAGSMLTMRNGLRDGVAAISDSRGSNGASGPATQQLTGPRSQNENRDSPTRSQAGMDTTLRATTDLGSGEERGEA